MPKSHHLYEAIATLVGATIGAGILGIPYIIASAGFITGAIDILIVFAAILITNLHLGEVILRTRGKHQLTGYAEKYLGKNGKLMVMLAMVFGIYGALIAYTLGQGDAIAAIFGGSEIIYSLIFFAAAAFIIFLGIRIFEEFELVISAFVILTIIAISLVGLGSVDAANLQEFSAAKMLLPFGVILFAFIGAPGIPEMAEELGKYKKELKKAIIIGTFIPLAVYLLFTLVAVGVVGKNFENLEEKDKIASAALGLYLGRGAAVFTNLFAIFSMTTAFLALGIAMKEMFQYDYKIGRKIAWLATISIPLAVFLTDAFVADVTSFISVLGITGAMTGGMMGILIILMHRKAKKMGERKPEYEISQNDFLSIILIAFFLLGIAYQLLVTFGLL